MNYLDTSALNVERAQALWPGRPAEEAGHPTPEVLARLGQAGVRIYRTDRDGAVVVETDGAAFSVTRWASRATDALRLASNLHLQ